MLESDLADEKETLTFYTKASLLAVEDGDLSSRAIFERIALDEEQHMGWLELQLDLLERMGEVFFGENTIALNWIFISSHYSIPVPRKRELSWLVI